MALRVDVPTALAALFSERSRLLGRHPRIPLAAVAAVLGFARGAQELIQVVRSWWNVSWQPEVSISAAELVALLQLLQFKNSRANSFMKELSLGGATRVVSLPSEELPDVQERPGERLPMQDADAAEDAPSTPLPGTAATQAAGAVGAADAQGGAPSAAASAAQARRNSLSSPARRRDPLTGEHQNRTPSAGCAAAGGSQAAGLPREPPWAMCDPEDVGMDREPLEKCRRYLHYRVGRKHFAGIVGGVVKSGRLVYFDEAGYADIAGRVPMRQDTLIRLFSMTKCIMVAAFLAYAEDRSRGVDLEDPVWKYIPSFKKLKLAPKRGTTKPRNLESSVVQVRVPDGKVIKEKLPTAPTLRHLLTHTAGFGYGPTLGDSLPPKTTDHYKIYYDLLDRTNRRQLGSLAEWVDELARIPLKVNPGSYWEYSFATDVLGRVVEVISGLPLDKAIEEKVTGPLGMVDTSFSVPIEKANRMGAWYEKKHPRDEVGKELEKVMPGATYNLEVIDRPGAESGWVLANCSQILSGGGTVEVPLSIKGGMVSTFKDYLRFLIMIRNFGDLDGVRVLRRETVQTMICNQIPAATGRRAAWVFNKKGQGFNFIGQVQVQHNEKETFQEKGELKKGGNTYASLAPGTVSGEYGWGGLGGPAWTIDPRADLIVLSMTQTASELDHEENLRFSARRAIHSGIFGPTAGPMKVTDYPPEGHEGIKGGKLRRTGAEGAGGDGELSAFIEAEQQGLRRGKTLKELANARGNIGHEVQEEEETSEGGDANGPAIEDTEPATPGATSTPLASLAAAALPPSARGPDAGGACGAGEGEDVVMERVVTTPQNLMAAWQKASPRQSTGGGLARKRTLFYGSAAGGSGSPTHSPPKKGRREDASPWPSQAPQGRSSKKGTANTGAPAAVASSGSPQAQSGGSLKEEFANGLMYARVCVRSEDQDAVQKARVTAVEGEQVEVVTEGSWKAMHLSTSDLAVIDESRTSMPHVPQVPQGGPTDFSFMFGNEPKETSAPEAFVKQEPKEPPGTGLACEAPPPALAPAPAPALPPRRDVAPQAPGAAPPPLPGEGAVGSSVGAGDGDRAGGGAGGGSTDGGDAGAGPAA